MVGDIGVAISEFKNGGGKVKIHGEIWKASSDEHIDVKEKVEIIEVNELVLSVKKINKG